MKKFDNRKYVIGAIIIAIALAMIIRLFIIQVVDNKYKLSAENNSQRHVVEYPARGMIYDRKGELMVYNQAAYDLLLVPRELKSFDTLAFMRILGIDREYIRENIAKAKQYSWHKPSIFLKEISVETYAVFQEQLYKFPGFFVQTRTLRKYPVPVAAHVLGYVGEVDDRWMEQNPYYKPGDYVGISGIERAYEDVLRGQKGVSIFLVDVHNAIQGHFMDGKYDTLAVRGENIVSTLDLKLQAYGELLMQNKIGSVVAIEPKTGEILCLISSPSYDPNLLIGRIRSVNYQALSRDTLTPLFNRAIMAQYPPGSTFKLVNGLIGLEEGVIDEYTAFSCNGPASVPIKCSHNHRSPISFIHAVEESCNSYYWKSYQAILNNPRYSRIQDSYTAWRNHAMSFGFGKKFNTDIPNELSGFIPDYKYYDKYYGPKGWRPMTIRSLSIGQGEIQITPLQMCNLAATIANRGYYISPHLVKEINGKPAYSDSVTYHKTSVSRENFDLVVEGMSLVYQGDHGTARWYKLPSIPMAGKTGTAENPHGEDHSIFIAFAPVDDPKIAISVVVENAGFGSTWAVPIATLMMEQYLTDSISKPEVEKRMIETNLVARGRGTSDKKD
ncbi:MAG: penicillin-binding protein 2 [Bacteroidales bacterium]|nr:penicillin-binding protein 2 [Bacteroidales bacterium]